jgi:Glycosyltransferase family 87
MFVDYWNMVSIYGHSYTEWYTTLAFDYSPFFYVLFYPFHFFDVAVFIGFSIIALIFGTYLLNKEIGWKFTGSFLLIFSGNYYYIVFNANIDAFLFPLLLMVYRSKHSPGWKGFLFGILTFKLTVIYVFPFLFFKERKNKNSIVGALVGGTLNYGWLILDIDFLKSFITSIIEEAAPDPWIYRIGVQYIWLWAFIFIAIYSYYRRIHTKEISQDKILQFEEGGQNSEFKEKSKENGKKNEEKNEEKIEEKIENKEEKSSSIDENIF